MKICEVAGCGNPAIGDTGVGRFGQRKVFGIFQVEDYHQNIGAFLCLEHYEACYRSLLEFLKNKK